MSASHRANPRKYPTRNAPLPNLQVTSSAKNKKASPVLFGEAQTFSSKIRINYGSSMNGFTPSAICPLMGKLAAVRSTYFVYPAGAVYGAVVHTPELQDCEAFHTTRFFPTTHDHILPDVVHGCATCPVNQVSTTSYAFPAFDASPAVVSIVPELL